MPAGEVAVGAGPATSAMESYGESCGVYASWNEGKGDEPEGPDAVGRSDVVGSGGAWGLNPYVYGAGWLEGDRIQLLDWSGNGDHCFKSKSAKSLGRRVKAVSTTKGLALAGCCSQSGISPTPPATPPGLVSQNPVETS